MLTVLLGLTTAFNYALQDFLLMPVARATAAIAGVLWIRVVALVGSGRHLRGRRQPAVRRRPMACRRPGRPGRHARGRRLHRLAHGAQPRQAVRALTPGLALERLHRGLRAPDRAAGRACRLDRPAAGARRQRADLARAGRRRRTAAVGRRRDRLGRRGGGRVRPRHHLLRRGLGAAAGRRGPVRRPGDGRVASAAGASCAAPGGWRVRSAAAWSLAASSTR